MQIQKFKKMRTKEGCKNRLIGCYRRVFDRLNPKDGTCTIGQAGDKGLVRYFQRNDTPFSRVKKLLNWMGLVSYLLAMNQRDESTIVEVDGKSLRLTHLSKVMFPDDGFTKAELPFFARP